MNNVLPQSNSKRKTLQPLQASQIFDAVSFVLRYKKKLAFIGWDDPDQIAANFANASGLIIAVQDKKITGICVYEPSPAYQTVHINNILCITKDALCEFIQCFRKRYGDEWTITGNRRGKLVEYKNTERLLDKLCVTH